MIEILLANPLLLLLIIAAIGYPLGRIKIRGSSLGVAAVLFVGLAVGSLHPDLKTPEIIYQFGLLLFVYTIGLSSGPGFFASFRRKGLRDNLFIASLLVGAALLTGGLSLLLGLKPTFAAGLYAGSLTNTPALAGVLEYVASYVPEAMAELVLAEPVIAYSLAYPVGVVGVILAIATTQRLWRVDYRQEAEAQRELSAASRSLLNRTILVTRPEATTETLDEIMKRHGWDVVFGRIKHCGELGITTGNTCFCLGDLVSAIGPAEDLDRLTGYLGETSQERLELDRSEFDYRRMFVSNPRLAGHRLEDLNLPQQFGALVTRVRRGDVELLARGDTVLELGDRVRVVTRREHMPALSTFFGDSYRAISEIDIMTFSLGIALGLLVGLIPIPLPGGVVFRLGLAGGPLVVALILGTWGRTGPLVWSLPYSANLTLRQLGLILFLAGVGTRAGYPFVSTLIQGSGLLIFLAGAGVTLITAFLALWIGYKLLKIPMGLLSGMLSGLQTQPAVLGFALEQADNDLPNIGYATVYPIATITKILCAQLLLALMS